jgi:hypothetical protein
VDEMTRDSRRYERLVRWEDKGVVRGIGKIVGLGAAIGFLVSTMGLVMLMAISGMGAYSDRAFRIALGIIGVIAYGTIGALTYYVWDLRAQVRLLLTIHHAHVRKTNG